MVKANLNTLSLPAPRNWVQKNGAKRRSASSENWLCALIGRSLFSVAPGLAVDPSAGGLGGVLDVAKHVMQGLAEVRIVDPVENFLADFFRAQHAGKMQ